MDIYLPKVQGPSFSIAFVTFSTYSDALDAVNATSNMKYKKDYLITCLSNSNDETNDHVYKKKQESEFLKFNLYSCTN